MQGITSYYSRIKQILEDSGFQKHTASSGEFKAAFTRSGFLANYAFLVAAIENVDFKPIDVLQYVETGRQWCGEHLKASWIVQEAGLNLVFMHDGQVAPEVLMKQVDSAGLRGAICQSITAIDVSNGKVSQETTWIVLGKVRKVLTRLQEME